MINIYNLIKNYMNINFKLDGSSYLDQIIESEVIVLLIIRF